MQKLLLTKTLNGTQLSTGLKIKTGYCILQKSLGVLANRILAMEATLQYRQGLAAPQEIYTDLVLFGHLMARSCIQWMACRNVRPTYNILVVPLQTGKE